MPNPSGSPVVAAGMERPLHSRIFAIAFTPFPSAQSWKMRRTTAASAPLMRRSVCDGCPLSFSMRMFV